MTLLKSLPGGHAPSRLAVASRYIFTPEIFNYLDKLEPGFNNEIQLTDAMRMMVKDHPMFGSGSGEKGMILEARLIF